ncbi:MAG: hypothetical protein IKK29_06375 [Christensenellaceae bacterium]|nr:hypothetical protein [Christensenellaceae bacterium]
MLSERLEQEIYSNNFELMNAELVGDLEALIIGDTIIIDTRIKNQYRKNYLMCHELQHGFTCPYDLRKVPKSLQNKFEKIADRRTITKLIPISTLVELYEQGIRSLWEFSDALEIDEPTVEKALKYYHGKYGYNFRYKDKIINFLPFRIVKI